MTLDLDGKTALVTGASGGIGGSIARTLASAGARVAITGTRKERVESLAGKLGERAVPILCNLGDRDSTSKLVQQVTESLGSLNILVNNAGITRDGLLMRMPDRDWDDLVEINLTASMVLCRSVLRGMMRGRWGRIVNITSVTGFTGNAGQSNYAASKAGLVGFTRSLAIEVASRAITVNCIAPGLIETDMVAKLPAARKDAIISVIPAGRAGTVEDIAEAVLFLVSDKASYITGQTIHVNGGMAML